MCGRFGLEPDEDFYPRFSINPKSIVLNKNRNISPGQLIIGLTSDKGGNKAQLMKWGLVPNWASDPKIGYKMINARAETIAEKPAYRNAFHKYRCLIPVSNFYEWEETKPKKIAHSFNISGEKYFALAGIYSYWKDKEDKVLTSCSIITKNAILPISNVHDRMPVILDKEVEQEWLINDDPEFLRNLMNMDIESKIEDTIVDYL